MAENPVIKKFGAASGANRATPSAGELQDLYNKPAFAGLRPGQGRAEEGIGLRGQVLRKGQELLSLCLV